MVAPKFYLIDKRSLIQRYHIYIYIYMFVEWHNETSPIKFPNCIKRIINAWNSSKQKYYAEINLQFLWNERLFSYKNMKALGANCNIIAKINNEFILNLNLRHFFGETFHQRKENMSIKLNDKIWNKNNHAPIILAILTPSLHMPLLFKHKIVFTLKTDKNKIL